MSNVKYQSQDSQPEQEIQLKIKQLSDYKKLPFIKNKYCQRVSELIGVLGNHSRYQLFFYRRLSQDCIQILNICMHKKSVFRPKTTTNKKMFTIPWFYFNSGQSNFTNLQSTKKAYYIGKYRSGGYWVWAQTTKGQTALPRLGSFAASSKAASPLLRDLPWFT